MVRVIMRAILNGEKDGLKNGFLTTQENLEITHIICKLLQWTENLNNTGYAKGMTLL